MVYYRKKDVKLRPRDKKIIKKAVQASAAKRERKFHEYTITTAAVSYSGSMYNLGVVTQGTSDTTRIGDTISPTSLTVCLNFAASATDSYNLVRIIVVQAKTTISLVSEVLMWTGTINAPAAFYNKDLRNNYTVLYDKRRNISSSVGPASTCFDINVKVSRPIHYLAGTGTIVSGGLYLIAVSDSAAVTHPDISGYSRIRFTDS